MSEPYTADTFECPRCRGESFLLGILGRVEHYRCRACGSDFSARQVKGGFVAPGVREHMTEVTYEE